MMSDIGTNYTHIALGFIFAVAIIAVNAIEFYFYAGRMGDSGLLFIVAQNVGIAFGNSFYIGRVSLSSGGLQETTAGNSTATPAPPK